MTLNEDLMLPLSLRLAAQLSSVLADRFYLNAFIRETT
jgi:hypothetical protein